MELCMELCMDGIAGDQGYGPRLEERNEAQELLEPLVVEVRCDWNRDQ